MSGESRVKFLCKVGKARANSLCGKITCCCIFVLGMCNVCECNKGRILSSQENVKEFHSAWEVITRPWRRHILATYCI